MREIKFRAWNSGLKQMEYCTPDEYWCIYNAEDSIRWGLYHRRGGERLLSGEHEQPLMQYTGLKDKNGVEIYEGDLLNVFELADSNSTLAGQLRWDNCEVVFNAGGFCLMLPVTEGRGAFFLGLEYKDIEVIGNIHKNPGLLK